MVRDITELALSDEIAFPRALRDGSAAAAGALLARPA